MTDEIKKKTKEKIENVEKMLGIFDQNFIASDLHVLSINETDYPEKFRPIIRRLQMAIANNKIRQQMEAEDEIIEELQQLERVIEEKNEALAEKDNALAEKDNALAEKDNALAEKDNALAEQAAITSLSWTHPTV